MKGVTFRSLIKVKRPTGIKLIGLYFPHYLIILTF